MQCRVCGEQKPETAFQLRRDTGRRRTECRACQVTRTRKWHDDNPGARARHTRDWRQRDPDRAARRRLEERCRTFGITVEDFERMLVEQDDHCAMCPTTAADQGKTLAIDHDHACCPGNKSCGRCVRGLLCDRCNTALGIVENRAFVARAERYLGRHVANVRR